MDQLARLIAIEEIRQLKARYFRFLDAQDFSAMAEVFCRDAVWDASVASAVPVRSGEVNAAGPVLRGRDTIMTWIATSLVGRTSTHIGHSHEVTVESADEASGIVAMVDYIRGDDRKTRIIEATGHYHERYRVEDGAWRIAETRLTRQFRDTFG